MAKGSWVFWKKSVTNFICSEFTRKTNVTENKIARARKLEIDLFRTCHTSMEPPSNVESTQIVLDIADDLQAHVMTENDERSLSLNCGAEALHWKLAVITVGDFLSRWSYLDNRLNSTVLMYLHARVLRDHDDGCFLTQDCKLVVADISC